MSRGLQGHLRLACSTDAKGRSYLEDKSFSVPIHVSKPYWDGQALLVNLVSPTAGLLEGDTVDCKVQVSSGASLVLSAPAATRVHTMRGGGTAKLEQTFLVGKGGFLEYSPEPLILQRDSTFAQHTLIDLDGGAGLLFLENLLPGRIAHGEVFEFTSFRNRLEILRDGLPVVIENYNLGAGMPGLRDWLSSFPEASYASFYAFSPEFLEGKPPISRIEGLHKPGELMVGMTQIDPEGWAVRILAASPILLRKAISGTRELLLGSMGRTPTDLRRF